MKLYIVFDAGSHFFPSRRVEGVATSIERARAIKDDFISRGYKLGHYDTPFKDDQERGQRYLEEKKKYMHIFEVDSDISLGRIDEDKAIIE